ncbi:RNA-directed DNA polymerase, eukaryota [Tanacetum coccineum]
MREALGNSGGILCTWDSSIFHKEHHIISDNFVALYGTWIPNQLKLLVISVYAPQSLLLSQMVMELHFHLSLCVEWGVSSWETSTEVSDLESPISRDEIRLAVWGCGEDKSPGPDGFTFEFFRKFWKSAFLPNRQILDGPFILSELLSWCKFKYNQAMVFKVDFAKAYDSIRWDYLDDVLNSFGFGSKWRSWIRGSLISGKASILVNGSPTSEFQFHRGLKQGDPLAPFLFILIMESLHLSFSRAVEAGIFTGIEIGSSLTISHLFYADDAVFIGEWSHNNLKGIMNILRCFSLLSGLSINVKKSQLLGIGISDSIVSEAAKSLGCSIMKTLSIFGHSRSQIVLHSMESLRRISSMVFKEGDKKIAWVKWPWCSRLKSHGGWGYAVSSFNKVILFKHGCGVNYISQTTFCGVGIISALHGSSSQVLSASFSSLWKSILNEVKSLKAQGVDLISHCKIRVGNGMNTSFWNDCWIGDSMLKHLFPRLFALETIKDISVADKFRVPITCSFRRPVRGGLEAQQLDHLMGLIESTLLSNSEDRWVWDLNGDGVFLVSKSSNLLTDLSSYKLLRLRVGLKRYSRLKLMFLFGRLSKIVFLHVRI